MILNAKQRLLAARHQRGEYMRRCVRCILLILVAAVSVSAQDVSAIEQQIERLRAQLREVADKEAELQARARQLEEDLSSQNVERSVAHIGTTDASALREQRREQLERQKAAVAAQLASLASSRSNLEATIATAEAEGVRLRAAALAPERTTPARTETSPATTTATPASPVVKKRPRARRKSKRVRRRPRGSHPQGLAVPWLSARR